MSVKYRYPESCKKAKAKIKERIRLSNKMVENGLPPDPWVIEYRKKNNETKRKWKSTQPKSTYVPKANSGSFKKGENRMPKRTEEQKLESKKRIAAYQKEWNIKNRELLNEKNRNKRRNDPSFRIRCNMRKRLSFLLRQSIAEKKVKTMSALGCSMDDFMVHLEKSFYGGMSFENYGEWHIDHITPCKQFDFTDPDQVKICFHYSNLQPLWGIDNRRKSGKIGFIHPIQ
jgi:hypothetical protein